MTDEERIAKLEGQIEDLKTKQEELRKELTKAQVDHWQGRIEDLEVQMHLGAMDTSDRIEALMEQLRGRWSDARKQLEGATSTAASAAETLRHGLEAGFRELRKALLETRNKVAS